MTRHQLADGSRAQLPHTAQRDPSALSPEGSS